MARFELDFVDWLRNRQRDRPGVPLGIGDDMAMVEATSGPVLISSDMLLDGVHFDTAQHKLSQIGRKAVACGLSDCAAMAVKPVAVTVSVALPRRSSLSDAQELYTGMAAIADEYAVAIVGGDTTRWDHPMAIDVTVLAVPRDGIEPVKRSGAKPGDTLYVTGPLGGSRLGKHLDFTPRVHESRSLAESLGDRLHAMIDISDGLSLDLWRVCQASGAGATLLEDALEAVISDEARTVAASEGGAPLEHALCDGEDFELLMAVSGEVTEPPVRLWRIGEMTGGELLLQTSDGRTEPLSPKGYIH